jgi:D-alanine transaminase
MHPMSQEGLSTSASASGVDASAEGIGYARGRFVSLSEPVIPIEDRAHQFGDGIYEVVRVYEGHAFALDYHLERFYASARAIALRLDMDDAQLRDLVAQAIDRLGAPNAQVYIQVSRAIARRDHPFPDSPVHLTMTVRPVDDSKYAAMRERGITLITTEDIRWKWCYIKSLNLLPNVLAKQKALDAGAQDAVFVRDNVVTECTSSNIALVSQGVIYTHPANDHILHGVTRRVMIELAKDMGVTVVEEEFPPVRLFAADELFIMGTLTEFAPVVAVDGRPVGARALAPDSTVRRLARAFRERIAREREQ